MTVFLVILEDHHADVQVEVFSTQEKAMDRFDEIVEQYDEIYHHEPEEGEDDSLGAGWIATKTLSCESDYVRVEMATVDEDDA